MVEEQCELWKKNKREFPNMSWPTSSISFNGNCTYDDEHCCFSSIKALKTRTSVGQINIINQFNYNYSI